jgi:hypothetical protein
MLPNPGKISQTERIKQSAYDDHAQVGKSA